MLQAVAVESSNIEKVQYDPEKKILRVYFKPDKRSLDLGLQNGKFYEYLGVENSLYQDFLSSASKGKFFHAQIKNTFDYRGPYETLA